MTAKAYSTDSPFPPLDEGKLRLYSMRFCPFAQRGRLILAHKKVPYETININLSAKPKWFFDKNPNGQVPVLEKGTNIVYESLVVAEYVDSVYPDPGTSDTHLIPADPFTKARDDMVLQHFGGKFVSNYYKFVFTDGQDEDALRLMMEAMRKLEEELTSRNTHFFGGEKPAFLDFVIWPWHERFPVLMSYNSNLSMKSFPLVKQWQERMLRQPAVKECLVDFDTHKRYIQLWRAGDLSMFDMGLDDGNFDMPGKGK